MNNKLKNYAKVIHSKNIGNEKIKTELETVKIYPVYAFDDNKNKGEKIRNSIIKILEKEIQYRKI